VETDAYIALGSNLGDRELNLLLAVAELGRIPGCRVSGLSRFYETLPVGMAAETPAFYNGVARLSTTLTAHGLLQELQRIEREQFGRASSSHPVSRRMDLDLLLYGDDQLATPELIVPHPRMTTRRFVLLPLSGIAADLRVPGSDRTVAELLADLKSDDRVTPVE
jgi:2-amino-4-hydroxy-6-hydroxymethyldihydropteridine diphosphokinase